MAASLSKSLKAMIRFGQVFIMLEKKNWLKYLDNMVDGGKSVMQPIVDKQTQIYCHEKGI